MSRLDDILKPTTLQVWENDPDVITLKREIKRLILELYQESEYEPYAFVEKVEQL